MPSNIAQIVFIASAYSPILLICWIAFAIKTNCYKTHLGFLLAFFILLILCWSILYLTKKRLTRNSIKIQSLKPADENIALMLVSYFLPFIELVNKDAMLTYVWIILLVLIILLSKSSFHYNPVLKFVFRYRYYEIQTVKAVSYILVTKQKLIDPEQIKAYSQLTDYVIIDLTT